MKQILMNSPCKINLGLNIIRKRSDGYHDLQTIFYPLQLCDKITYRISSSFSFNTNDPKLNLDGENNLIVKAVRQLERISGKSLRAEISLEKNIPIGAGLGGGSSNAAITLLAINELFNLKISKEKLNESAINLGSDVPFFLQHLPAYAESRGEKLSPCYFSIPYYILLINPGIHISTKWAYEHVTPQEPDHSLLQLIKGKEKLTPDMFQYFKNDFEPAVFDAFPEISRIKTSLYDMGAKFALMSGSGSSVFGLFDFQDAALKAKTKLAGKYFLYLEEPE